MISRPEAPIVLRTFSLPDVRRKFSFRFVFENVKPMLESFVRSTSFATENFVEESSGERAAANVKATNHF